MTPNLHHFDDYVVDCTCQVFIDFPVGKANYSVRVERIGNVLTCNTTDETIRQCYTPFSRPQIT